jgi:hypothetical protein
MRISFVALSLTLFAALQAVAQPSGDQRHKRCQEKFDNAEQRLLGRESGPSGREPSPSVDRWLTTWRQVRQIVRDVEDNKQPSHEMIVRFWNTALTAMIPDDAEEPARQARDKLLATVDQWNTASHVGVNQWRCIDASLGRLCASLEELAALNAIIEGGRADAVSFGPDVDLHFQSTVGKCEAQSVVCDHVLALAQEGDILIEEYRTHVKLRIAHQAYESALSVWAQEYELHQGGKGTSYTEAVARRHVYECLADLFVLQEKLEAFKGKEIRP